MLLYTTEPPLAAAPPEKPNSSVAATTSVAKLMRRFIASSPLFNDCRTAGLPHHFRARKEDSQYDPVGPTLPGLCRSCRGRFCCDPGIRPTLMGAENRLSARV